MISTILNKIPTWAWLALCAALAAALGLKSLQAANARADLATLQAQVAQANQAAEAQARQKEADLRRQIDATRSQLAKEKAHAKDRQDRLLSDIRAGAQRLSIAASCSPTQAGADPSAPTGAGAASARAELDPEAAAALVSIAADGDEAIRERNACVQAYNAIRSTLSPD